MSGKSWTLADAKRVITAIGNDIAAKDPADLHDLIVIQVHARLELARAVQRQRLAGATDVQIGEALGMTRQAVQQRWPRPEGSPVGAGARWVRR